MVLVRIIMSVLPEKKLEVTQTLLSMIEQTVKEPGCISYAVFCDTQDQNRFSLVEEWESRENLNRYLASHRFGILLGIKALLSEPMEIQINTVRRTEDFSSVEAIRKKSAES